jgi:non-ribosomal peptide synthetase component E (peptide arylation enzyme)
MSTALDRRIRHGQPALHSDEQIRDFHADGRWGARLLVDHLDARANETPDKIAIVEDRRRLSYRDVVRMSENVAAGLLDLGIGRGDVVAIQAPNWAELPIVHFATDRIGAIFVPLSEGFRDQELRHLLRQSRARVIFCADALRGFWPRDLIEKLRGDLPDLRHVISLRASGDSTACTFESLAESGKWRHEAGRPLFASCRADADAPSHVMVSSGTTGLPRCSLFSDNNTIVKLLQQYVRAARVGSADVAAALAPAGTGATGYNYPILAMLLLGGTSVLLEHWNSNRLDQALELIAANACTVAVVVPAQLARLVQAADLHRYDLGPLRVVTNSGAKLPRSVAESVERLFGCTVQTIYGTSEAGATAMTRVDDTDAQRRNTVGQPLDGQEVRLLDAEGRDVSPGEVGEVCWRGANKSYGFLNDAEGTAKVWDADGLLHSGDLGRLEADGYLQIVGRKKDMIIRGGQNVNPGAIEDILIHHPGVAEVAVVAFEDAVLGERIAACVVAKSGHAPSLESLKSLVRDKGFAAWHQPELLVPMNELPRNAGGKIDKTSLSRTATQACKAQAVPAA